MSAERGVVLLLLAGCEIQNELPSCPDRVVVNEVMAGNHDYELEPDFNVDWIELYNATEQDVALEGWSLSRTPIEHEFEFPESVAIGARDFLLVIAGTFEDPDHLTTGFDLNRDGDALFVRAPVTEERVLCDEVTYPDQHADVAWQRVGDGSEDWCFATVPTPGESNTSPCVCADTGDSPWC